MFDIFLLSLVVIGTPIVLILLKRTRNRQARLLDTLNFPLGPMAQVPQVSAYLVAHLDVTQSPPVVKYVGIYSCEAGHLRSMGTATAKVDVVKIDGKTFHEAHQNMVKAMQDPSFQFFHGWTRPFLSDRDGGTKDGGDAA